MVKINNRLIPYLVIIGIMVIRYFALGWVYPQYREEERLIFVAVGIVVLSLLWESIILINKKLNQFLPYEKGIARRLVIQVLLSILVVALLDALAFLAVSQWVKLPDVPNVVYVTAAITATMAIIAINVSYFGVYFFRRWKEKILEAERLGREKAEVEKEWAALQYANLVNQLNPHFFFNSIASLQSLIQEDQQLASEFLSQLSKVYRYILNNRNKQLVTLDTEIHFVENYLSLLKTRFGNTLHFNFSIASEQRQAHIVPVTLQVLVENAIKHNIMTDNQPLHICFETNGKYLAVSNSHQPKKIIENSNGIGLNNMKSMYAYLSKEPLQITKDDRNFSVKVPLIQ